MAKAKGANVTVELELTRTTKRMAVFGTDDKAAPITKVYIDRETAGDAKHMTLEVKLS